MADPGHAPDPRRRRGRPAATVITDARSASSREMSSRVRRYTITMAFRTACFVSMIFVHGSFRWVLLALAVFLPYIAVLAANQVDQRGAGGAVERGAPQDAPQLTTGTPVEVIHGQVVEDDGGHEPREPGDGRGA